MSSAAELRNRHPLLFATLVVITGCVAQTFLSCAPTFVGLMAQDWHYTEAQQGFTVTAEIGGATIGTLLVSFALARRSVNRVVLFALLTIAAGNLWMATGLDGQQAVLARLISGFGCGLFSGVGIRFLALGPGAARLLGYFALVQSVYAMAMMSFVLPALGRASRAFEVFAALALACLPILLFLGKREPIVTEAPGARAAVNRPAAYLTLFSFLAMYVAIGMVWTFAERLGTNAGMPPESVSRWLGAATMIALVACVVMPWLISRGLRIAGCFGALLLCGAAAAALAMPAGDHLYIPGIIAFLMGWTGASIALYATLPSFDPDGRLIPLSTGFIGMGYAIGAAAGGYLIETTTLSQTVLIGAGFCAVAMLTFLGAHLLPKPRPLVPPAKAARNTPADWTKLRHEPPHSRSASLTEKLREENNDDLRSRHGASPK